MNRIALSSAIATIVAGIINESDYKVIVSDQSAPRPSGAYGAVKIISTPQETLETLVPDNNSGYLSSSQHKVMVTFNFYKEGSYDKAMLVRRAFWRRNVADQLQEIGLGLSERGTVENLTESLEAVFEERANFICRFNYVEVDIDVDVPVQPSIVGAEVNGDVTQRGETYPINIEIKEN